MPASIWLRATLAEVNRLDGAHFEHTALFGEDFVGDVNRLPNPGFANALAVIATGDDDIDVDAYLRSRGLKRELLEDPEYAAGFLHGVIARSDEVELDADEPAVVEG